MIFMWFYSFIQNLYILGLILLIIGLVGSALVISLKVMRKIDGDDFDTTIFVCVPFLIFGLITSHFPSLSEVYNNFQKYEELTKEFKDSNLISQERNKEIENDEVPIMLKRSCSERMCR